MSADGPYCKKTERRLTLVSQGGGIGGGAYVVGVMKAFKEIGILPAITQTITSSAGTPAVVYPLLGKGRLAEYVWTEEVTKKEVINLRRAASNRPIFDIDYLIDEILSKHPFDAAHFHSHVVEMHMSATRIDRESETLEHHIFTNREQHDPLQIIKATIAIPIVYGRSVVVEGREYIDGGILRQVSFEGDIQIITEPKNKTATTGGYGERLLLRRYFPADFITQKIHEAVRGRHALYMKEYLEVVERHRQDPYKVLIQPEQPLPAGVIENDPRRVETAIKMGYEDAMKRKPALYELLEARLAA